MTLIKLPQLKKKIAHISKLNKKVDLLENHSKTKTKLKVQEAHIAKLNKKVDLLKKHFTAKLKSKEDYIVKLQKKAVLLKQNLINNRAIYLNNRAIYRKVVFLNNFIVNSERLLNRYDEFKADIYIMHEIQPFIAADIISRNKDTRVICDVVEYPRLDVRAIPTKHTREVLAFLHLSFDGFLRKCSHLLTVSDALAAVLRQYKVPVSVIQNYRYDETVPESESIRKQCRLEPEDRLLLCISGIASDFELILNAMTQLNDNIHLAVIGGFAPLSYKEKMDDLIEEKRLTGRVHLFNYVPYQDLTAIASGADVGLIIRNPEVLNNWVSLPNRVFDYIASGLPICSPDIPDITNFISANNCGAIVYERTAQAWADAIEVTLKNRATLADNAKIAARKHTWESREEILLNAVGEARTVTFLSFKNLTKNNRTKRMALTLAKSGRKVNICCLGKNEPGVVPEHESIRYIVVDPS